MTAADLPVRDVAVLTDLARVRLLTGQQLERLHFSTIPSPKVRSSIRRRTLSRLHQCELVTTLPRKIGGERAGSAGLVYTLDAAGKRLTRNVNDERVRRPWVIGQSFVAHTLDVAELYVRLRERERAGGLQLLAFDAEPASWYPTTYGTLKPDAFALYSQGNYDEHRWIEVDRSTESLPALQRKLATYLNALQAGAVGARGVFPLVVITVLDEQRELAVRRLIAALPAPAEQLFKVERFAELFITRAGRSPPKR